jgi:hypothetical protein
MLTLSVPVPPGAGTFAVPCVVVSDANVVPNGTVSVRSTLRAVSGPWLVTTMRYVSGRPGAVSMVDGVMVTATSTSSTGAMVTLTKPTVLLPRPSLTVYVNWSVPLKSGLVVV